MTPFFCDKQRKNYYYDTNRMISADFDVFNAEKEHFNTLLKQSHDTHIKDLHELNKLGQILNSMDINYKQNIETLINKRKIAEDAHKNCNIIFHNISYKDEINDSIMKYQAEIDKNIAAKSFINKMTDYLPTRFEITCKICFESKNNMLVNTCGHTFCNQCYEKLPLQSSCPTCRTPLGFPLQKIYI
jgi:hypothetical protein